MTPEETKKPEVGKWYEFPRGGKYKCIAFEFGYYYFSNLIDDEPDVVVYQDACDFSKFKEVQHEVDKLLEPTSEIVPIGTKVRVTDRIHGHNFKIGSVVTIYDLYFNTPYECTDLTGGYNYLSREEFEIIEQ